MEGGEERDRQGSLLACLLRCVEGFIYKRRCALCLAFGIQWHAYVLPFLKGRHCGNFYLCVPLLGETMAPAPVSYAKAVLIPGQYWQLSRLRAVYGSAITGAPAEWRTTPTVWMWCVLIAQYSCVFIIMLFDFRFSLELCRDASRLLERDRSQTRDGVTPATRHVTSCKFDAEHIVYGQACARRVLYELMPRIPR